MDDSLVVDGVRTFGLLADRPRRVNPLDAYHGPLRVLRRTRLKEWVGFLVTHPDMWMSMIVQDAKYLTSSEVIVFDPSTARLHHHEARSLGSRAELPDVLFGHEAGLTRSGFSVRYIFGVDGRHHIHVDIAASRSAPAMTMELELQELEAFRPLVVSGELLDGSMFTYKVAFGVGGWLEVGERRFEFDAGRDLAIIDEHRSLLPYVTEWTWATTATRVGDDVVGVNLASRPAPPGATGESCLWVPADLEPLSSVVFTPESDDPLATWAVTTGDGRVDLRFEPVRRHPVRHQLGVFAVDYSMWYGRYSGTIAGGDRTYQVDRAHGVCERMKARL